MAELYLYVVRTPTEVKRVVRFLRGDEDATFLEHLPTVWVGTASWKKADLFGEADPYVPAALQAIEMIIGTHLPLVDEVLIEHVRHALRRPNTTPYPLAVAEDLVTFMDEHQGDRAFTVRWV